MIEQTESLIHWNSYLALESDLQTLSRYIEFNKKNQKTYSIEIVHLLLAACSEVDVLSKQICKLLAPGQKAENIEDYRKIITKQRPSFVKERVSIPRFSWRLDPWANWRTTNKPPIWWSSHNKVKHQRNEYFQSANLKNLVNAMAGLLICEFYFHRLAYSGFPPQSLKEMLSPWGTFLSLRIHDFESEFHFWTSR